MKRFIAILLIIVTCLSLSACKDGKAARIENVENLISELSGSHFSYDDLYLTEHGEIHHNEWSDAYAKAIESYNALSADEKSEVKNAYILEHHNYHVSDYEKILIEQKIVLYCKEAAVEDLKDSLINKSSYEEYDWELVDYYYFTSDNTFRVELRIEYSATNRAGGRIDDIEYAECKGTYQDGKIIITEL